MLSLSYLKIGQTAEITEINESYLASKSFLPAGELERRLLEMEFSEGVSVTVMHEGPFGRDPIVVLVRSCHLVALRRSEASAVLIQTIS